MGRQFVAIAAVMALVPMLACAGPAAASQVRLDPASGTSITLVFHAARGEINDVDINLQGSSYTVQDMGGRQIHPVAPCKKWQLPGGTGSGAMCPAENVTALDVDLGDQADQVFLGGISHVLVPAFIRGGAGRDSLSGGEGPDTIDAFDGEPDSVDCREGNDTVYADRKDTVKNCETVKREPAPGSAPPAPPRFFMSVTAPSRARIRAVARGLPIGVRCSERCTATARLFIGARTARRLGLGNGADAVEVGQAVSPARPATRVHLKLRLRHAAARAFRRSARRISTRLVVRGDGAADRAEVHSRIKLSRAG
jgi:Ca2+-binding RTX toxin-like protein